MGPVKSVLITGAAGYVGRYTVRAARARGHKVRALVRRQQAILPTWQDDPEIEVVVADLSHRDAQLEELLQGVDAVIHAAASLSGDARQQETDTIDATARLCNALAKQRQRPRLVLVSSIAVYAGCATPEGGGVSETTPLETALGQRDAYCAAKLAQETAARELGTDVWIMRVGAIFGPGRVWNAHIGLRLGPLLLRLGKGGEIPLCHVRNCARALVLAAETPVPSGGVEAVNLVDDNLPDRVGFVHTHAASLPPLVVPFSWHLLKLPATLCGKIPALRNALPGLLRPATLRARMQPVTYANTEAKTLLNWAPEPMIAAEADDDP